MHASTPQRLTWQQRLFLLGTFVTLFGVLLILASALYLVHQSTLTVPVVPQTTVQTEVCPIGDDWSCALR